MLIMNGHVRNESANIETQDTHSSDNEQNTPPNKKRRSNIKPRYNHIEETCSSGEEQNAPPQEQNTPPQEREKLDFKLRFGHIADIKVGDVWKSRLQCSIAGMHIPLETDIHCYEKVGCYSIVLPNTQGSYIDSGTCFTYTVVDGPIAAALRLNEENRHPLRLVRGDQLDNEYAPGTGFRYEGLYTVEGSSDYTDYAGRKMHIFLIKRLDTQDPPPWTNPLEAPPSKSNQNNAKVNHSVSCGILKSSDSNRHSTSTKQVTISPKVEMYSPPSSDSSAERSIDVNDSSESSKQISILKFFPPLKRPSRNKTLIVTSKSSRGNYLPPINSLNIKLDQSSTDKSVRPNCVVSNGATKSSRKRPRKYPFCDQSRRNSLDIPYSFDNASTLMGNLIKRNNEKLRLHKELKIMKYKTDYKLKSCVVKLVHLFSGFDFDSNEVFLGFSDEIISRARLESEKFNHSLEKGHTFYGIYS